MTSNIDLETYFKNPITSTQKQYEVVRAFVIEKRSAQEIATIFNYKISSVYTFIKNAKSGILDFFHSKNLDQNKDKLH